MSEAVRNCQSSIWDVSVGLLFKFDAAIEFLDSESELIEFILCFYYFRSNQSTFLLLFITHHHLIQNLNAYDTNSWNKI